jgi:hypothetical protein
MKARRCLIFFFDVSHAYVMAEATKTLSLEDDTTHEPGDQLWSKSSNLQCYAKAWTLSADGSDHREGHERPSSSNAAYYDPLSC